ncbi:MAG: pyruvate kinase [Candidatus Nomurabacteria bacterium]
MHTSRKTKIVATIGPGSEKPETLAKLFHAGVNVTRSNMSHGDHEEHSKRIKTIKAVAKKEKVDIALLLDLSGPKIRIGDFKEGFAEIVEGQEFILSGKKCEGDSTKVYFNYPNIKKDIKEGQVLMLDDGRKKLTVTKVIGTDIYTHVDVGGKMKSRRGVNIPGAYLSISAITEKDKADLEFGIKMGVDIIALSFVRTGKDIEILRELIKSHGGNQIIISKIETEEALQNIDSIIETTDAVMVARGDLAVEIGPERVPNAQKMIIRKCNELGKPVIVATQMLESMINTPVPTRAEVSDVANAIFDGADAVMLSEETALGSFPVEAVSTMVRVALEVEQEIGTHNRFKVHHDSLVDSISSSIVHIAEDVKAKVIVSMTMSGTTPRLIARYRPQQPILTITPHEHIAKQLILSYGCYPLIIKKFRTLEEAEKVINTYLKTQKIVEAGDRIVISAGIPFGTKSGLTNTLVVSTAK